MYKLSKYVYQMENRKREHVLANMYTGRIYKVSPDKKKAFMEGLNHPSEESKLQKFLIEEGVFLNEEEYNGGLRDKIHARFNNSNQELELIILPTEQCNFRCSYCYEEYAKGAMSKEVQEGIINYVAKNIDKYEKLRVSWFGGEPLCAKHVMNYLSDELKRICREKRKPFTANITTNAYNLDLETFKQMQRKNRITRYQITIDGLKECHDSQRKLGNGQGSFDVIMKNLRDIRDYVKSSFFEINIRCNITKEVYEQFDEYVDLMEKEFGDDERFNFIWRIAWPPNAEASKDMFCDNELLGKLILKYADRKIRLTADLANFNCMGGVCYAANKDSFVIGSDGTVYKCTVAFKEDINHVGKLYPDGTMEIDRDKFKYWTERKECMDIEKCESCNQYPTCLGIYCPRRSSNEQGEFVCNGYKIQETDAYLEYYSTINEIVKDVSELI